MHSNTYLPFLRLLAAICLAPFCAAAQGYAAVDAHARSIGHSRDIGLDKLAAALSEGCTSDAQKVRAFYVWISDQIKYDIKGLEKMDEMEPAKWAQKQSAEQVMKRKKGVCEGYANLFLALCQAEKIQCIKVVGIVRRPNGRVPSGGHAWNIVRADGNWRLVDPCWGAGYLNDDEKYVERFNEKYFFTAPETMILDHFPEEPLFQMLPTPLTEAEFRLPKKQFAEMLPEKLAGPPLDGFTSPGDSIDAFGTMNASALLRSKGNRLLRVDPKDEKGYGCLAAHELLKKDEAYGAYRKGWGGTNTVWSGQFTTEWCDQQLEHLKTCEEAATRAQQILKEATKRGCGSAETRQLQKGLEPFLTGIEDEREGIQKIRKMSR